MRTYGANRTAHWHPFENMSNRDVQLTVDRADGIHVWDDIGRKFIDATAGLWYCNVGYGRDRIVDAIEKQLRKIPAFHTFGPYSNAPADALCARLSEFSPIPHAKVFLTNGGSDAVDTACKLARRYWDLAGKPEKKIIVSKTYAYHGMHGFGTSLSGITTNAVGYGGSIVGDTAIVAHDDLDALETLLVQSGDTIAAIISEPVIGAGGVLPPPEGYGAKMNDMCKAYDVLLISDEVICGFGRVGASFGCVAIDQTPDMILFAKGITSGYQQLGGVIVGERVQEPFWQGAGARFNHGYTYSGHAASCAAAMTNLDIIEEENLIAKSAENAAYFHDSLTRLENMDIVEEVRTAGLMGAIEIDEALRTDRPDVMSELVELCWNEGVLTRPIRGVALQFSPALTIERDDIDETVARFETAPLSLSQT